MAAGHALSGMAAGAGVAAAAGAGTATAVLAGAVTAGAALLPDLDHPRATASRRFGPVSAAASERVRAVSVAVYRATRTPADRHAEGQWERYAARYSWRDGGRHIIGAHRYLSHTLAAGVAAGAATALACVALGLVAVVAVVAVAVALAVAALGATVAVVVALAAVAWVALTPDPVAALDGLGVAAGGAVALGCWVHALGDALTASGVPLLWPLPIRGRRWYPVRIPGPVRFTVGGRVERWLVWPVLALVCVLAVPGAWAGLAAAVPALWTAVAP